MLQIHKVNNTDNFPQKHYLFMDSFTAISRQCQITYDWCVYVYTIESRLYIVVQLKKKEKL